jgi:hypothetical protein
MSASVPATSFSVFLNGTLSHSPSDFALATSRRLTSTTRLQMPVLLVGCPDQMYSPPTFSLSANAHFRPGKLDTHAMMLFVLRVPFVHPLSVVITG